MVAVPFNMIAQLALAPMAAAGSAGRPVYVYGVALFCVLLIAAGVLLIVLWLRQRNKRDDGTAYINPAQIISRNRLREIWERFLSRLPSPVRTAIPDYSHFVVFGNTGSGKSALISRKVDWQGQTSQFIPSFTADPLMQVYLGSKILVQELSAVVQDATARGYNQALNRLWSSLEVEQVPTVVIVLSASMLASATPDQLRQQAQLLRGKINVLSEACGGPARVRICLSNMDRVRGYSDLARFLFKNKLPLELDLGAEATSELSAGFYSYERYLPRALTTQSMSAFESVVDFLRNADQLMAPVVGFVQALSDRALASQRPEVQRIYFSSLSSDEQVGNPFDPPPQQRSLALGSLLSRWLRPLGIRPIHALLGLGVFLIGLLALTMVTRQHHGVVQGAADASFGFTQAVERARQALSSGESDVVRRAELRAGQALVATREAESRFRPLRLIYRPDKRENERRFLDGIRRGYLFPSLERAIRQRDRDKILSALVAIYATRNNTLGALINAQPTDWSTDLGVPRDTLLEYIHYSSEPWTEVAIVALPPLLYEGKQLPITDLGPWRAFLAEETQAVKRPYISHADLVALRQRSDVLREALSQIRRGALLRQLYRNLAEESPLDMVKLFGRDIGVLTPAPWLVDHQESLDRVLRMVRESDIQIEQAGTKSLYQLLRWLNESSSAAAASPTLAERDGSDRIDFLFPSESKSYEVSRREWLELLARSRKRTFSLDELGNRSSESSPRTVKSCRSPVRGKHTKKRRRATTCEVFGSESGSGAGSASEAGSRSVKKPAVQPLPLWSQDEFAPKLAAILTSKDMPAEGMSDVYNRAVYEREVLPLVQELKKALSGNRHLSSEEKIALSRRVQSELATYSRGYCEALLQYHLGYQLHGHSPAALHADLVDLIKPGSRFVARLRTLVDNLKLSGLDEPYLQPLASCIADFRPIVELMAPQTAAPPAADAKAGTSPAPPGKSVESKPEGLADWNLAVAKLITELDRAANISAIPAAPAAAAPATPAASAMPGTPTNAPGSPPVAAPPAAPVSASTEGSSALAARLSPLGRSALAMYEGSDQSALRHAEQFLDKAGVGGPLRRPFLAPFLAVYQTGASEIEHLLAHHWRDVLLPQITPLFNRFPFERGAEREVAPTELDFLSERKGSLFTDLRNLYAPAISESGGVYSARRGALGALRLPSDLLPRVNTLAKLSRALFAADGNRKPLQLAIRGLPGPQTQEGESAQPALAFLQVGKAAAYGFNQQASAKPLSVDWWAQGAAVVGVEKAVAATGRKHTQTLEVADSAWSLFRLLQRSTLDGAGVSSWRIFGEGDSETHVIRFVITPDPWELFGAHAR